LPPTTHAQAGTKPGTYDPPTRTRRCALGSIRRKARGRERILGHRKVAIGPTAPRLLLKGLSGSTGPTGWPALHRSQHRHHGADVDGSECAESWDVTDDRFDPLSAGSPATALATIQHSDGASAKLRFAMESGTPRAQRRPSRAPGRASDCHGAPCLQPLRRCGHELALGRYREGGRVSRKPLKNLVHQLVVGIT
jgi:hypothetical protein